MNGVILYEGPSKLDGAPIVVIATGLKSGSRNAKTGDMVQTWILRSDIAPHEAVKVGADASICGNCPHRGDGTGKGRSCYVTVFQAPLQVWKAYKRGNYERVNAFEASELFAGRMVRLGSYGDPMAAPYAMWKLAVSQAAGWTGYTHQWRRTDTREGWQWAELVMASADSLDDLQHAQAMGWRTFRVTAQPGEALRGLEVVCPASEEAGKRTSCESCRACMGTSAKARVSIAIAAHGAGARNFTRQAAAVAA